MLFHIITNVWGERHVDLFLDFALPNVLSPGNLPALVRRHDVVYRFFTSPEGRAQIERSALFARLVDTCAVEFLTPLGQRTPDVSWHVHWFHRSAAEAKVAGAMAIFVPPDHIWAEGTFERMGDLLAAGRKGVACPFVLVVGETLVPEARARFLDQSTGTIAVPPAQMWSLAHRHVHPLHALAIPGAPHARPAFELHWPVGRDGMISRYAVRELTAFDPARCPISFLWNADGPEDLEGIHFVTDSDEMLTLSVDPLTKYFVNYIVDHSCDGFDLARTTRHPLNETRQTRVFATRSVDIHRPGHRSRLWNRTEAKAVAAARDLRVGRAAMLLHEALTANGADIMAGLMSVALLDTHFARRWRSEPPFSVIVPVDAAFSAMQRASSVALAGPGRARELVAVLLDHVVIGRLTTDTPAATLGGMTVERRIDGEAERINQAAVKAGPIELEQLELYLVDTVLSPRLGDESASAIPARAKRVGGLWSALSRRIGRSVRR
ncbi:fasciclin domain-containing protein [Bradyrhizobium sp.]|uniref:fasciclin domain-containing protein n=1 Tax=Bradyrhizobium sp. TaxID=376 RepID=UPI001EBE141C|nr:fasciclin domain-containing protein [Bradyrhizobium sp.]MBV9984802.1 fasciclin domain-containing protein [Bradyrhizobium sp.]